MGAAVDSKSLRSAEALQHAVSMVLPAEEDGQNANFLCLIVDIEVKNGAVFCDATQSRRQLRQKRSLMWRESNGVDFCFDQPCAFRSSTNGVGQRIAQADIRIYKVLDNQPEISVAFKRPYYLKGHRISSSRRVYLRGADDFPLDSETRLPADRQSKPSTPRVRFPSTRSLREGVRDLVGPPHSRSKSAHPQQAFGQRRLAAWKLRRMFSRTCRVTLCSRKNYHSVVFSSICDGTR
jgi:hypothetical protein